MVHNMRGRETYYHRSMDTIYFFAGSGLDGERIIFAPQSGEIPDWAEVHFILNGGEQTNVRMIQGDALTWAFPLMLRPGDSVEYFFTYCYNGVDCDSETFRYNAAPVGYNIPFVPLPAEVTAAPTAPPTAGPPVEPPSWGHADFSSSDSSSSADESWGEHPKPHAPPTVNLPTRLDREPKAPEVTWGKPHWGPPIYPPPKVSWSHSWGHSLPTPSWGHSNVDPVLPKLNKPAWGQGPTHGDAMQFVKDHGDSWHGDVYIAPAPLAHPKALPKPHAPVAPLQHVVGVGKMKAPHAPPSWGSSSSSADSADSWGDRR